MIALDTNVLVRYFVRDDPRQFGRAAKLLESELTGVDPGFVSLVTLCELVWVLQDAYGFEPARIAEAIHFLLETRQIEVENDRVVAKALTSGHRDIADAIIHFLGEAYGCERTVTFDRRFARLPGVELLG